MEERKIEGYWHKEPHVVTLESKRGAKVTREFPSNDTYLTPIPNVLTETQAKEIYDLILIKENIAERYGYRGWTNSRITGETLGSHEYKTDKWIWPADFAKHYVLDHKVKPTDEFLKYIGYEQTR